MSEGGYRIPRRAVGAERADPASLGLAPAEQLVFARVNGEANEWEIAIATGSAVEQVTTVLSRLERRGVVSFVNGASPSGPPVSVDAAPTGPPPGPAPLDPPRYDPSELVPTLDIDIAHQKHILDIHSRLDDLDHYELLGVRRDADKRTIKRAYHELAALFHPDRFFRKEIGAFKAKTEAVFTKVTQAQDVLAAKDRRAEYDVYLVELDRTRGIETKLQAPMGEVARIDEEIRRILEAQMPVGELERAPSTGPRPAAARVDTIPPDRASKTSSVRPPMPSAPPVDPNRVRDVFARRLLGNRPAPVPPRAPSSGPMQAAPPAYRQSTAEAMDALRRRYEERVVHAREAHSKKYREQGEAAMREGDAVAAANAFRVAADLSPADAELQRAAEEATRAADRVLGEGYVKQAEYEEKSKDYAAAARSWIKAARAMSDNARAHERAAVTLLKIEGRLHEASQYARQAVAMAPSEPRYRITLAYVYLAANLQLNARRELEAAMQLGKGDATIEQSVKRALQKL